MTFLELQDTVLDILNLSTDTARDRIKGFLNRRLRAAQTSCNMGRVRRGTATFTTTSGEAYLTLSGILKPITITFPALNRVLLGHSLDEARNANPNEQWIGAPRSYAVTDFNATTATVRFMPIPDGPYDLTVDGIRVGANMVDDDDVPALPEDFHDLLINGALADEFTHFDKPDRSAYYEKQYAQRLSDCRYFISKSVYLHRAPNTKQLFHSAGWWWLAYGGPMAQ